MGEAGLVELAPSANPRLKVLPAQRKRQPREVARLRFWDSLRGGLKDELSAAWPSIGPALREVAADWTEVVRELYSAHRSLVAEAEAEGALVPRALVHDHYEDLADAYIDGESSDANPRTSKSGQIAKAILCECWELHCAGTTVTCVIMRLLIACLAPNQFAALVHWHKRKIAQLPLAGEREGRECEVCVPAAPASESA